MRNDLRTRAHSARQRDESDLATPNAEQATGFQMPAEKLRGDRRSHHEQDLK